MHNVDIRNVSLGQIMYFVKVAETLNISQSAEYFHLTQPVLSKKIASLEGQLDLQLFIRSNRIESLTPAGQYLYEQWKHIVSNLEETVQQAHILQTGHDKSLVIACMDSYRPELFLLPLLDAFHKKRPDVYMRVEADSVQDIRRLLQQKEADVIFSILYDFEERNTEEIICHRFGETTHCVCMKNTNPLAQKKTLTVEDLRYSDFICISPQVLPEYPKMLHDLCRPFGFVPNISSYVSSANSLTLNIYNDSEIFICDRYYADRHKEDHVLIPLENTRSSIIMAWRKDNPKTYLKDFLDTVSEYDFDK